MLLARLSILLLLLAGSAMPAPSELARGVAQCMEQSCFSVHWTPKRFAGAMRLCEALGSNGHLMTVRSTVSAEIISLLLGSEEQRAGDSALWIGLRRPHTARTDSCPDLPGPLRGFQWVTGDSKTDYTSWKAPGAGNSCSQRCVTVQSDLAWEERDCESRSQGFLCEFTYPGTCSPLYLGSGLAVTYVTPFRANGSNFMALPPDTVASISPDELELHCRGQDSSSMRWVSQSPGPWHCQVENGGCSHSCREESGIATCACPQGLELADDGRQCVLPPDPCSSHGCAQLCFLNTTDNVPQCMCQEGYELGEDGTSCHDVDDCQVNKNICDQQCQNTVGGFHCLCHPGYEMIDNKCEDIDECMDQVCEQNCINLPGTHRCDCDPGYIVDSSDPKRCQIFCNSSECPAECDPHTMESCRCPPGYITEKDDASAVQALSAEGTPRTVCVDIDECFFEYCDQACDNTPGSFRCSCRPGYTLQADLLSCKLDGDEEGSSEDVTTPSVVPGTTPPPPERLHLGIMIGIAVGILSIVSILIAIVFHWIRKHTVHTVTDCKCKQAEKGVVLRQVTLGTPSHQKL
ncbi:thrombomodulin-like [Lissotriton helveticus]